MIDHHRYRVLQDPHTEQFIIPGRFGEVRFHPGRDVIEIHTYQAGPTTRAVAKLDAVIRLPVEGAGVAVEVAGDRLHDIARLLKLQRCQRKPQAPLQIAQDATGATISPWRDNGDAWEAQAK